MTENVFWYFAGLLTVPAAGFLWFILSWAFGKTEGSSGCVTDCVGSPNLEPGEHFNITVWFWAMQHRLLFSTQKGHKEQVRQYWQDIHDSGGQSRTDVGVIFHEK